MVISWSGWFARLMMEKQSHFCIIFWWTLLIRDSTLAVSYTHLVLKNARIINVFTDEIDTADIALIGNSIVGVGTYPVSYTHLDVYKRQALRLLQGRTLQQ